MESAENREQPIQINQPNEGSNDSPPLSKVETLKLLNNSIDQLEETIKGISENSSSELPSSTSINDLLATTQELANTVSPDPESEVNNDMDSPDEKLSIESASIEQPPATSTVSTTAKPESTGTVVDPPKPKQNKVVLISIGVFAIAMAVVAVFWIWYPKYQTSLASVPEPSVEIVADNDVFVPEIIKNPKSESVALTTTEIADLELETPTETPIPQDLASPGKTKNRFESESVALTTTEIADLELETPTETPIPQELASPGKTKNRFESESVDLTTTEIADLELETPIETPIPQDLASPGKTKNLKVVTIKPELTFTPEQNLVAALQAKIADITQNYPTDFIDTIKVNLAKNTILVGVNDHWYDLNESRQSKIGNEILERSRQLKFNKLKFQDSTGALVARNPVVGNNIIIIESDKDEIVELDEEKVIESDKDEIVETDKDVITEPDKDEVVETDKDEVVETDKDVIIELDKDEIVETDKNVIIKLDKDEIVETDKDVIIKLDRDDEQLANDS